jgi:hypothetical protein
METGSRKLNKSLGLESSSIVSASLAENLNPENTFTDHE